MKQCMLTTIDNPFNPFNQFASWFEYDSSMGYNSCGRLMRIAQVSDDMSDTEENAEIERAINEIIVHDFTNLYTKVSQELKEPQEEDFKAG